MNEGMGAGDAPEKEAGATDIRQDWFTVAAHQIGTVRMGTDPTTSVVDPNLKTHDLDNLYLMGSGCFPSGSANPPTLTICALAIRAAEHVYTHLAALR